MFAKFGPIILGIPLAVIGRLVGVCTGNGSSKSQQRAADWRSINHTNWRIVQPSSWAVVFY